MLLTLPLQACMGGQFVGEWEIEITGPDTAMPPYQVEIKYPKWMKIELAGKGATGSYRDQFGYECTFPMIAFINAGQDLLFTMCGTTKHPESFAPVHHAKVIDGKLVGIVFTTEKMFEWEGRRVPAVPAKLTEP